MGKSKNSRKGTRQGKRNVEEKEGKADKRQYQHAKRAAVRGALAGDCTAVEMVSVAKGKYLSSPLE